MPLLIYLKNDWPGNLLREFVGLIGEQQSETQNEKFLEI